jgi:hypothetical protein
MMTDDAPCCDYCGYNLTGLTIRRCPECGRAFVRRTDWVSRVPWRRRFYLGSGRAYVRTLVEVVVCPGVFARDAKDNSPRALVDAEDFRRITCGLVAAVVALASTALACRGAVLRPPRAFAVGLLLWPTHATLIRWVLNRSAAAVENAGARLGRRLRLYGAGPVLEYACAPLLLLPLPALGLAWFDADAFRSLSNFGRGPAAAVAWVGTAAVGAAWMALAARLIAAMTPSWRRSVPLLAIVIGEWACFAVLGGIGLALAMVAVIGMVAGM